MTQEKPDVTFSAVTFSEEEDLGAHAYPSQTSQQSATGSVGTLF